MLKVVLCIVGVVVLWCCSVEVDVGVVCSKWYCVLLVLCVVLLLLVL